METFCKMTEEEKKEMNVPIEEPFYFFRLENEVVGYAKVDTMKPNNIYIFIREEKRGNGYGTRLFKNLIEMLKNSSIPSLELTFSSHNLPMIRILKRFGGEEISRREEEVLYSLIIP